MGDPNIEILGEEEVNTTQPSVGGGLPPFSMSGETSLEGLNLIDNILNVPSEETREAVGREVQAQATSPYSQLGAGILKRTPKEEITPGAQKIAQELMAFQQGAAAQGKDLRKQAGVLLEQAQADPSFSKDQVLGLALATVLPVIAGAALAGKKGAFAGLNAGGKGGALGVQVGMEIAKEDRTLQAKRAENLLDQADDLEDDAMAMGKFAIGQNNANERSRKEVSALNGTLRELGLMSGMTDSRGMTTINGQEAPIEKVITDYASEIAERVKNGESYESAHAQVAASARSEDQGKMVALEELFSSLGAKPEDTATHLALKAKLTGGTADAVKKGVDALKALHGDEWRNRIVYDGPSGGAIFLDKDLDATQRTTIRNELEPIQTLIPKLRLLAQKTKNLKQTDRVPLIKGKGSAEINTLLADVQQNYLQVMKLSKAGAEAENERLLDQIPTPDSLLEIFRQKIPSQLDIKTADQVYLAMADSMEKRLEDKAQAHNVLLLPNIATRNSVTRQRNVKRLRDVDSYSQITYLKDF